VFDFMGEDNEPCKQSRPEPGAMFMRAEGQMGQGVYMDAYQDYSSVRRKNVKPSKKWRTNTVKAKGFRPSSDTNQRMSADKSFKTADKVQTRSSGIFRFGSAAEETRSTVTSLRSLQELPRHQNRAEDQGHTRRNLKSRSKTIKVQVRSKMTQRSDHKGNPTGKRRGTAPKPRKTNQYELRVKELETEMEVRAQRRIFCWKKKPAEDSPRKY